MKLCLVLLVVTAAVVLGDQRICKSERRGLSSFHGRRVPVKLPCKYPAVRQRCGKYNIVLTPGQNYFTNRYYLDTMWLGIKLVDDPDVSWHGRTTNKLSVLYLKGNKTELFNQKKGSLNTSDVLKFTKTKTQTLAGNNDFTVTFQPWDPEKYRSLISRWQFECHSEMTTISKYPNQLCGMGRSRTLQRSFDDIELTKTQLILLDIFNQTGAAITQTDTLCKEATNIFQKNCTTPKEQAIAIQACGQILTDGKRRRCVTKYSCTPMQTFVDCLQWACSGFVVDDYCEKVGVSIDLCRNFLDGNLTKKVKDADCYKQFQSLDFIDEA